MDEMPVCMGAKIFVVCRVWRGKTVLHIAASSAHNVCTTRNFIIAYSATDVQQYPNGRILEHVRRNAGFPANDFNAGASVKESAEMKTHSDAELFALLRGDVRTKESAFTELYNRHSPRVYQYCRYIMDDSDAADDVFQDTFIKFMQSAEKGTTVENVPAYLLRIARNLCLNAKRDNKLAAMDDIEDVQIPLEDKTVENRELGRLIEMALGLISEEYREAFILQEYNGLSYKEIADVMGVPVSTVRNRVVRAKKRLREILTPYLEEEKR